MNSKTLAGIEFDSTYSGNGGVVIAGADEVGRGPLAGPVVVASAIPDYTMIVDGVRDSKNMSENARNKLFEQLCNSCIYSIAWVYQDEIDRINILNATRKAFKNSLENLTKTPDFVLMDYITGVDVHLNFEAIKKGDAKSYAIGCASIIAKVTRDNYMIHMDEVYPEYGFAKHKGYGTAQHIAAIREHGPCPLHRRSFLNNILG